MNVHGFEITEEQQSACIDAMVGTFRAANITAAAIKAGVPEIIKTRWGGREYHAMRVADRLIQKMRKVGMIQREGKEWRRT